MATWNEAYLKKMVKEIAKEQSKRQFMSSQKSRGFLKEYIASKPPTETKNMVNHLSKRYYTKGDKFTAATSYGFLTEILFQMMIGKIKTKEDIDRFEVHDSREFWLGGDTEIPDASFGGVPAQIKGVGGEFIWRRGVEDTSAKLGVKTSHLQRETGLWKHNKGSGEHKRLVTKAIDMYLVRSPAEIRIVSPIYPNPAKGFFDMGQDTFRKLASTRSDLFTFTTSGVPNFMKYIPWTNSQGVRQSILVQGQKVRLSGIVKEWKDSYRTEFKLREQWEVITKSNWMDKFNTLAGWFEERVLDQRIDIWERHGALTFRYTAEDIANAVNPLIRTFVGQTENKEPFYRILRDLMPVASTTHGFPELDYYLRYTPETKGNKEADYFYNMKYHSRRY